MLVISRKDWLSSVELSKDATETPNVNLFGVLDPENDLGRSVEARLDVGVDLLIPEAPRAKVDYFEVPAHCVSAEDVFWLQITVDDLVLLKKYKALEELDSIVTNLVRRESNEASGFKVFK